MSGVTRKSERSAKIKLKLKLFRHELSGFGFSSCQLISFQWKALSKTQFWNCNFVYWVSGTSNSKPSAILILPLFLIKCSIAFKSCESTKA